jgi:uncharacterized LabA/DUF88 family protein
MALDISNSKVGVYIDAQNISMNGGFGMQFDVLREFACREGAQAIRLNAYVSYDSEWAKTDEPYKTKVNEFYFKLRDLGYKVIQKHVKWYTDDTGNRYGKANADLDMAVDALLQSDNLDRILLATGDGDFIQVIRALQNKGCRIEVVAFNNVSSELRNEADMFMSGYLIPDLLPIAENRKAKKTWGELGYRVRGHCYSYRQKEKYGFMRFMKSIGPNLWITDARNSDSPYGTDKKGDRFIFDIH